MFTALISAVSTGLCTVVDKVVLTNNKTALSLYISLLFILLFIMTMLLVPFFGRVEWTLLKLPSVLFLVLMLVVVSVVRNIFFYQSIKQEAIYQHEVIMMTAPIVSVLMAAVFFPETFRMDIFILSLVASSSLILSKFEKNHFHITKTSYHLILAVVLLGIENVISKELLSVFSPVALYGVRAFFISGFFLLYYQPNFTQLNTRQIWLTVLSAAMGCVSMITMFYAFDKVGIIYTTIISMLAPIIIFLASWKILHEKIKTRVLFSFIIILICSVWATLLEFR